MNHLRRITFAATLLLGFAVAGQTSAAATNAEAPANPSPWAAQAAAAAKLDRTSIPYDGKTPNKLVCDTTLRALPDGSWALFMLAGDDFEPSPKNYVGLTRSRDEGRTWTPLEPVDIGFPREGKTSWPRPDRAARARWTQHAVLLHALADMGPRLAVVVHAQR